MSTVPPPPIMPPPPGPPPRGGCGKKVLIGCGVAALAVAMCFLAFILYVRSKPQVITDFVMRQVESHFASDVTETDKQELRAAYADFRRGLIEHRVSKEPLDRMRATLMTSGPNNEISHEQVREMIRLFREKLGSVPSSPAVEITEPPSSSAPTPQPTP
jgi:hypothetical protein